MLIYVAYRTTVPYLHFHQIGSAAGYSQTCQRRDQHTDCDFIPRTFSFSLIPVFLNKGELFRTVRLALSAENGLSKPLPLVWPRHCFWFAHNTKHQGTLALHLQLKIATPVTAMCSDVLVTKRLTDMVS